MGKKPKVRKVVLAEGEATGHAHVLQGEVEVHQDEFGPLAFDVEKPAPLTHEEHKTISIPAGKFESGQAREYDHFEEESRRVED